MDAADRRFTFGDFTLDTERAALFRRGEEVRLRPQAYDVLLYLVRSRGRLVTKQEFFEKVWGGTAVTDGALVQCVIDIRQALGEDGAALIRTVPRRGYVFEAPAIPEQVAAAPENPGVAPKDVGTLHQNVGTPHHNAGAPHQNVGAPHQNVGAAFRRPWVVAAATLVVLILAALAGRNAIGRWIAGATAQPVRSMAVLPLENLSGDPAQDYFVDGLTDELITGLAQLDSVRVISRTSIMRFKGIKRPLPEIAKELNVDAVIEGTVSREGDRIRIRTQLIDARTDVHLWARSYERKLGDVLGLQGDLARAIASEVNARLTPSLERRLAAAPALDLESEEMYLQGRYHANKGSRDEITKGVDYFQRAIVHNPRDARSYAALATAYLYLADFYLPSTDMLPQAKEAALKALAIDDSISESHVALGAVSFLYDWDWAGAERAFVRALDLNPGSADAHIWYATFLVQAGRFSQAMEESARARALDPLSLLVHVSSGWVYYLARRPDDALAEWRRVLDLEPHFAFSHTSIWAAYLPQADFAGTRIARSGRDPGEADTMDVAALIGSTATRGKREDAGRLIAQLRHRSAEEYICPYEMATAEAVLGRRDEAIDWLRKTIAERSACVPSMKTDPRLDSLRGDPRFAELLKAGRFPQ